jgi:hypothetical protein
MSRDRSPMSRDREGAVRLPFRFKNRHRLPLAVHHISNCRSDIVPIPQPSSATVPPPSLSIRPVRAPLVQSPARIRFEVIHHFLGFRVRVYHRMNVSRSYMRRQKRPVTVQANLTDRAQHRTAVGRIQQIRSLIHQMPLVRCTRRVGLNRAMSMNVMVPIHGTGFVAVQMGAIARERNQVRHARLFYTAPSRSRLGRTRSRLGRTRSRLHTIGSVVQHYKHIPASLIW